MLTGVAFEEYLRQLFELLGYTSSTTRPSGDFGGDVIITKDGRKIVVQAKQYASKVGFEAVKEAHFAKSYYGADEAWVVTTSSFTQQAAVGAAKVGVRLVPGTELTELIRKARGNQVAGPQPARVNSESAAGTSAVALRGRRPTVGGGRLRGPGDERFFVTSRGVNGYGDDLVLVQYRGAGPKVTIPDGVLAIGEAAFVGEQETIYISLKEKIPYAEYVGLKAPYCKSEGITEVVIPEGVTRIGGSCFRGCKNLETISLPSTLEVVGPRAFQGCGLREATLRAGIEYGESVYSSCHLASSASVEHGVTVIPESCFWFSGVEEVSIPETVKTIGRHAFQDCLHLKRVVIPEGMVSIGEGAFSGCKKLEEVYLPLSLRRISVDAFEGCPVLGGRFIGDVFDLEGVSLSSRDRSGGLRGRSVEVDESTARSDAEIDRWAKEYRRTHPARPYVDAIESLEIDAARIRKGTLGEAAKSRLRAELSEMGLREDLITRFIERRNYFG